MISRGTERPANHYSELNEEHRRARDAAAEAERYAAWERQTQLQKSKAQPVSEKGIHKPETAREENLRHVEENRQRALAESRQRDHERTEQMAREHAQILVNQSRKLEEQDALYKAAGREPPNKPDQFHPGADRYKHERGRHDEALAQSSGANQHQKEQHAAGKEYASFMKEQQQYEQRIATEHDTTKSHELKMQKDIRAAEHLAYTSRRIADQDRAITGDNTSERAEDFTARAENYERQSETLRKTYKDRGYDATWEGAPMSSTRTQTDGGSRESGDAAQTRASSINRENTDRPARPATRQPAGRDTGGRSI